MDGDKFVYATLYASVYGRIAVTINCTFTIIAFILLFSSDVSVHFTSFSKKFHEDVVLKLNYSNPLQLSDVQEFFDPAHPGHELFNKQGRHLKIEYGATWTNRCWNDPPLTEGLPSVLRLIEFHSPAQALLRFTFLTSLSLRPILTYARSLTVLTRLTKTSDKGIISKITPRVPYAPSLLLISSLVYAASPLQFFSTLAGSLVLMWQQDHDFYGLLWAPYYTFALFYPLHMIVYTSIELLEPRRTVVPKADALCEYIILLVITLFSLLEWTDVWRLQVTVVVENPEELAMIRRKMNVALEEDDERF
ncbi:hypothetical protein PRIPAC_81063 [Pristionchus pacificus]|uniref:Uncharacterized protein n=1 Tax=Pristionchus pacificus TaxID=54126 RepID=A0A2A6CNP5_PRIPA|nr:hypothetical protein PRIPAC_81063 [Pristionchus pacificus]|eukprot:PDM79822.1 hypothetical protein PRIPAC_32401 [Pristionchus pacificus]